MRKWWDPLTILGKFCDVKKWVGRPNKETVKNLVGRREYMFILFSNFISITRVEDVNEMYGLVYDYMRV